MGSSFRGVADAEVTTQKLSDNAVTNAKLADNSVSTDQIVDWSVTSAKLGSGAVTNGTIATGAVSSTKIGTEAVTNGKIGPGAVSGSRIASGAVTEDKIGTGAVTEDKIGTGAVTAAKIGISAVTNVRIDTGAVTMNKLGYETLDYFEPTHAFYPVISGHKHGLAVGSALTDSPFSLNTEYNITGTGHGGDIIWSALDEIPTDIDGIIVKRILLKSYLTCTAETTNGGASLAFYAGKHNESLAYDYCIHQEVKATRVLGYSTTAKDVVTLILHWDNTNKGFRASYKSTVDSGVTVGWSSKLYIAGVYA